MSKQHHWEQVYTNRTPTDVSWFQTEPTQSLAMLNALKLSHDAAIIDVGGGASHLVDHLLSQGFRNLAVLDISAKALAHSQSRLGKRAAEVEWFVEDITKFSPSRKFDVWHDRAVFHFLTDASDRKKYVANLSKALAPQGHVIISTFAIGGPDKCSNLDIVQYDEKKLQAELGENFVLRDVRHEMHTTPASKQQAFIYCHFQKVK